MFDICFVVDSTGSMDSYLCSLKQSLTQIFNLSKLIGLNKVCIVSYKDFDVPESKRLESSGWQTDVTSLLKFVDSLRAYGGGDFCEMAKTVLSYVIEKVIPEKQADDKNKTDKTKTLVYWFTDAPPHFPISGNPSCSDHYLQEEAHLGQDFDWINLCKKASNKDLNIIMYPIIMHVNGFDKARLYFSYLAHQANGICFSFSTLGHASPIPELITQTSLNILINLLGERVTLPNIFVSDIKNKKMSEITTETMLWHSQANDCTVNDSVDLFVSKIKLDTSSYKQILTEYKTNGNHETVIHKVFDEIITENNVKVITYNPIFGQFWREICKKKDSDFKGRLCDKMSQIIPSLDAQTKVVVRNFIEQSYLQFYEINDICNKSKFDNVLIYTGIKTDLSISDVLEMNRSCNAKVKQSMAEIFSNLNIVKRSSLNDKNISFVPMDLNSKDLFSILAHPFVEGIKFNLRGSVIMAMFCIYTNVSILTNKACDYLNSIKGNWFDASAPENMAYGFLKLALKVPEAFTAQEFDTIHTYYQVNGLMMNGKTNLIVHTGYQSNKSLKLDYKTQCSKCNENRSTSLMTDGQVCAFCSYQATVPETAEHSDVESYMCECRTCQAHYAVVQTHQLNVEPKCHFCRTNTDKSCNQCNLCKNNFVCPTEFKSKSETFTCMPCKDKDHAVHQEINNYTIYDFVMENKISNFGLFKIKPSCVDKFFACSSLYSSCTSKLWSKVEKDSKSKIESGSQTNYQNVLKLPDTLMCKNKSILNVDSVHDQLINWINAGYAEREECSMCFEDFNKQHNKLAFSCNYKNCGVKCCKSCLTKWYNSEYTKPGCVINLSNLSCPFCKKTPNINKLSKFNSQICELKSFDMESLKSDYYYAWCMHCHSVKEYCEKVCSQVMPTDVKNFICQECCEMKNENIVIKDCPKCGIKTEKTGGCNHINCVYQNCNCHWCFVCEKQFDPNEIYKHMSQAHGGYGIQDFYESDDYNSDYDDDYD